MHVMEKHHRKPAHARVTKSVAPFQLICSDLWGPSPHVSNEGFWFYISFVDDYSRYTWLFPMQHKSQVVSIFLKFKSYVELQFNTKIKQMQTDWGGEFRPFFEILSNSGIIHRITCPHAHTKKWHYRAKA